MDMRNERLVFERICKSCCGVQPNDAAASTADSAIAINVAMMKPQYFLVTPKLLPGLRAMDNNMVSVLFIWSGPGVINKWQLPEVIDALISPEEQEKLQRTPAAAKRTRESGAGQRTVATVAAAEEGLENTLFALDDGDENAEGDEGYQIAAKMSGGNKRSLGKTGATSGVEKKARSMRKK